MSRSVNADCVHYKGSRPCAPHKKHGVICASCPFYAQIRERIGIIKLGAMGDVLRTTALIRDIVAQHPEAEIIWLTLPESIPILHAIPAIHRVIDVSANPPVTDSIEFDTIYSLDNADEGVTLAEAMHTRRRRGFRAGSSGHCEGVYDGGDPTLYGLGLWDDLKRANTASYLSLLAASAGLKYAGGRAQIHLSDSEIQEAEALYGSLPHPRIGINTDAGTRWLRKQWNLPYVETSVEYFVKRGCSVILLGGSNVEPFNERLANRFQGSVVAAKTAATVRALFSAIGQTDILLTGDTLAMHAAWALSVPIVALFGPTSAQEIDLGKDDLKLVAANLDCLGCYLHTCDVAPHCMDRLTPEIVIRGIETRLAISTEKVATK